MRGLNHHRPDTRLVLILAATVLLAAQATGAREPIDESQPFADSKVECEPIPYEEHGEGKRGEPGEPGEPGKCEPKYPPWYVKCCHWASGSCATVDPGSCFGLDRSVVGDCADCGMTYCCRSSGACSKRRKRDCKDAANQYDTKAACKANCKGGWPPGDEKDPCDFEENENMKYESTACCINGECSETTMAGCCESGGLPLGPGSACTPGICDRFTCGVEIEDEPFGDIMCLERDDNGAPQGTHTFKATATYASTATDSAYRWSVTAGQQYVEPDFGVGKYFTVNAVEGGGPVTVEVSFSPNFLTTCEDSYEFDVAGVNITNAPGMFDIEVNDTASFTGQVVGAPNSYTKNHKWTAAPANFTPATQTLSGGTTTWTPTASSGGFTRVEDEFSFSGGQWPSPCDQDFTVLQIREPEDECLVNINNCLDFCLDCDRSLTADVYPDGGTYDWQVTDGAEHVSPDNSATSSLDLSGETRSDLEDDVTVTLTYTPPTGEACAATCELTVFEMLYKDCCGNDVTAKNGPDDSCDCKPYPPDASECCAYDYIDKLAMTYTVEPEMSDTDIFYTIDNLGGKYLEFELQSGESDEIENWHPSSTINENVGRHGLQYEIYTQAFSGEALACETQKTEVFVDNCALRKFELEELKDNPGLFQDPSYLKYLDLLSAVNNSICEMVEKGLLRDEPSFNPDESVGDRCLLQCVNRSFLNYILDSEPQPPNIDSENFFAVIHSFAESRRELLPGNRLHTTDLAILDAYAFAEDEIRGLGMVECGGKFKEEDREKLIEVILEHVIDTASTYSLGHGDLVRLFGEAAMNMHLDKSEGIYDEMGGDE